MRRKDQGARREQLTAAARQVLLERGAVGVRVKDIAQRAKMAPSSVLYYYPNLDDLLLEVSREAIHRYAERRSAAVWALTDPVEQLALAIQLGVPTGPDDDESRLLYELDAFTGSSSAFAVLTTSYFDRQVALYRSVLEAGVAQGAFTLDGPADAIARGMVAMEDGLGLQVVIGHPGIDSGEAEAILLRFAAAATGANLAQAVSASVDL